MLLCFITDITVLLTHADHDIVLHHRHDCLFDQCMLACMHARQVCMHALPIVHVCMHATYVGMLSTYSCMCAPQAKHVCMHSKYACMHAPEAKHECTHSTHASMHALQATHECMHSKYACMHALQAMHACMHSKHACVQSLHAFTNYRAQMTKQNYTHDACNKGPQRLLRFQRTTWRGRGEGDVVVVLLVGSL